MRDRAQLLCDANDAMEAASRSKGANAKVNVAHFIVWSGFEARRSQRAQVDCPVRKSLV